MYLIKNALKNLIRNKGRNVLTGGIFLFVIVATVISIMIYTTTEAVINNYNSVYGSKATIYPNISSDGSNGITSPIEPYQYIEFSQSDLLTESSIVSAIYAIADKLQAVAGNQLTFRVQDYEFEANARLIGYSGLSMIDDFRNGERQIISGRIWENDNECIISEDFAALNDLDVGSTINLDGLFSNGKTAASTSFTVCGVYSDNTSDHKGLYVDEIPLVNRKNEILTSYESLMQTFDADSLEVKAYYYLKSPSLLEKFQEEVRGKGLSSGWAVTTYNDHIDLVKKPVEGMGRIALLFMGTVLVLGTIILMLLSASNIRERKYEVGVLRAMGMKKKKVLIGFLLEAFALICLCLCIGVSIGIAVSQPIANRLFTEQVAIVGQQEQGLIPIGDSGVYVRTPSEIEIRMTGKAVMGIVLVTLFLAVIANIVSVIYITKHEPIQILAERN